MKSDSLNNCIAVLEKLRDATNSQLDTRVLLELDTVIAELKRLSESHGSYVKLGTLSTRVLEVMVQIISLVSNLADLMK